MGGRRHLRQGHALAVAGALERAGAPREPGALRSIACRRPRASARCRCGSRRSCRSSRAAGLLRRRLASVGGPLARGGSRPSGAEVVAADERRCQCAFIECEHAAKWYGQIIAVNDVSLSVPRRRHRPARPQRRRQVDAAEDDGRTAATVEGRRQGARRVGVGQPARSCAASATAPSTRAPTRI